MKPDSEEPQNARAECLLLRPEMCPLFPTSHPALPTPGGVNKAIHRETEKEFSEL